MKYTKFIIKKFKGIEELEIDLTEFPNGKIFPLVGLNESGKTTILEAINFFQEDFVDDKKHKVLHKKDSGSFTGNVEVTAKLLLEQNDNKEIKDFLKDNSLTIEKDVKEISIIKKYEFKNSSFEKQKRSWIIEINTKSSRQKNYKKLYKENNELWNLLIGEIGKYIPKILYFPDFLFDFPNKIYLENIPNLSVGEKDKEIQNQYRKIIDDILHSINNDYSLNNFLTKIKSNSSADESASSQIKSQIESALNQKILTPWNEIFSGTNKSISIEIKNDDIGRFLEIKVKEGASSFLINERSLGFRWFFGFILFTEFRKSRVDENGEYLFLFDEPASNLHESSQQKLLLLFEKLTDKSKIIYSTHSPYLINSKSILNSLIVRDIGRENEDSFSFRQEIKATPYKQFVANYPNEETHFKPILDVLDFRVTDFDLTDEIVFFEGKFDYYTFKWIKQAFFSEENFDFKFYPGASVDKYENIFREYLAHNKKFIAIFDADGNTTDGGKGAKKRYIENISQELENQIFTLQDIDATFDTFSTENLFTDTEKLNIQKKYFPNEKDFDKRKFNFSIQQFFIETEKFDLSNETKEKFEKIFKFIETKFNQLKK